MIFKPTWTAAKTLAIMVAVVTVLDACYMPARFDAEIEITRTGYYGIIFDGYMASIPLYDGLRKKEISRAEEKKKVAVIKTDLTRDSAVKEFQYFKQGHFKVHWEKEGDILSTGMVAFLRRNQNFLSIKYVKKTGLITLQGASVMKVNAERLRDIGLGMQGQIRVITDAKVVEHNATKVRAGVKPIYVWDIKSLFGPSPKLLIAIR